MDINSTQFTHGVQSLQGPHRGYAARESVQTSSVRSDIQDEVRFSDEALKASDSLRSEEFSVSGVRFELVNRIKSEIAAGTYDTSDKMDIAFERMLDQLSAR